MKRLDLISNVLSLLNPTLVEEKATITQKVNKHEQWKGEKMNRFIHKISCLKEKAN